MTGKEYFCRLVSRTFGVYCVPTPPPMAPPQPELPPPAPARREELPLPEKPTVTRELIEEICDGCCPRGHYCTLKEILLRVPRNARTLMQIKCIEKLKYERSVAERRAVDWDEALDIWVNERFAERYAAAYRDGIRLEELYMLVKQRR